MNTFNDQDVNKEKLLQENNPETTSHVDAEKNPVRDSISTEATNYKGPWGMTQQEFIDYVTKFKDYPVEIWKALSVISRTSNEGSNLLNSKPSVETAARVAPLIHTILISTELFKGKAIVPEILKDYPWFSATTPRQFDQPDTMQYGFDATDFNTAASFQKLLELLNIEKQWKECQYDGLDHSYTPMYLWEGPDIHLITANNPLLKNGYASFIGIEEHTDSWGNEGLDYIGFTNIRCIVPTPEPVPSPSEDDPVPVSDASG